MWRDGPEQWTLSHNLGNSIQRPRVSCISLTLIRPWIGTALARSGDLSQTGACMLSIRFHLPVLPRSHQLKSWSTFIFCCHCLRYNLVICAQPISPKEREKVKCQAVQASSSAPAPGEREMGDPKPFFFPMGLLTVGSRPLSSPPPPMKAACPPGEAATALSALVQKRWPAVTLQERLPVSALFRDCEATYYVYHLGDWGGGW